MPKHATAYNPGMASDPIESLDIAVNTKAQDTRPITPDEIKQHPKIAQGASLSDVAAELLADQISERLLDMLGDRPPWRQEYTANVAGWGDLEMMLPRYPTEAPAPDADGNQVPDVELTRNLFGGGSGTFDISVVPADYRIRGNCRDQLYYDRGWVWTTQVSDGVRPDPLTGLETSDYVVGNGAGAGAVGSYTAGYVLPGQVGSNPEGPRLRTAPTAYLTAWQPLTVYGVDQSTAYGDDRGSWLIPADRSLGFMLECTTAGTSLVGPTEPDWDPIIGAETVEAGGPTWTTRAATPLPYAVRQALWFMVDLVNKENLGNICDASSWGKVRRLLAKACV